MTGTFRTSVLITKEVPGTGATSTVVVKMIDHRPGTKARRRLISQVASQFMREPWIQDGPLVPRSDVAPSIQLEAYEEAMMHLRSGHERISRAIARLEPLKAQIMFGPDTRAAFLKEVAEGKHLKDTSGDRVPTSDGRAA